MIPSSREINPSKWKATTDRLVQCWLESPLCSLLVADPRLISHLLAPISLSVTLPATWNSQLHLGLLKKARQPKWRRCSQWRLTCPVACCKKKEEGGQGAGGWGWGRDAFLPSDTHSQHAAPASDTSESLRQHGLALRTVCLGTPL